MIRLTVVIINYNGESFLDACLDSVLSQRQYGMTAHCMVVDNASTDRSMAVLTSRQNEFELIVNQKNVGFSPAVNQVLEKIDTDYIWLLNNDTEFSSEQNVFSPIIEYMDHQPTVVGVSPRLVNTDGSTQIQGGCFGGYQFKSKTIRSVSFLSGAALFIRTDFFKKIGGFDDRFFFYNDDVDFAKNVKKYGKSLVYFPMISITHHGGLSTKSNTVDAMIGGYMGSLYLCQKFYSRLVFLIYLNAMIVFLRTKYVGHRLGLTDQSAEWVVKMEALFQRISREF